MAWLNTSGDSSQDLMQSLDHNHNHNNTTTDNQTSGTLSIVQFYLLHAPVAVYIDRIISPIFYLVGLPCNPLCAFIWLGRSTRRSNSSAIYLGALSISHTAFLLMHIVTELKYAWGVNVFGPLGCELFLSFYMSAQYLAPLLVLGFTVERFIAVCYPFAKEKYCTVRRAVFVVMCLLAFCCVLGSFQAYLWTYDPVMMGCNHRPELQDSKTLELWTWITELIVFGATPLAALLFNILVIREIGSITSRGPAVVSSSSGGHNQASTITLLTVSFYLIVTWLPATITFSLERQFQMGESSEPLDSPTWRRHFTYFTVRKCVEEVTLSNSACYFFIYYLTGKHFRDRVKQLLCRRPGRGRRGAYDSSYTSANGRSHMACSQYVAVSSRADNGHSACVTSV